MKALEKRSEPPIRDGERSCHGCPAICGQRTDFGPATESNLQISKTAVAKQAAIRRPVVCPRAFSWSQASCWFPASLAEARRAFRESERDKQKAQQITTFLQDMLQGVGPSVALGRDTTMLREILNRTADRIGTELTNQPAVEADLR